MKRQHVVALMLLVLVMSIAGCGGSNNSQPCRATTVGGIRCSNSSAIGGSPLPDSPYAPRF